MGAGVVTKVMHNFINRTSGGVRNIKEFNSLGVAVK
jgi:hypothetical protein